MIDVAAIERPAVKRDCQQPSRVKSRQGALLAPIEIADVVVTARDAFPQI
jgi:hypothetical protein